MASKLSVETVVVAASRVAARQGASPTGPRARLLWGLRRGYLISWLGLSRIKARAGWRLALNARGRMEY